MKSIVVDAAVIDLLMPDLVGHDKRPSAFILYLYLWRRAREVRGGGASVSRQQMSRDTGLSKSAVQDALRVLGRRGLLDAEKASATAVPRYRVLRPWRRPRRR